MRINGGNTDELYKNGRLEFAQSLQKQHPDVVQVVQKYGRWHHQVDYSSFKKKNHLILKGGVRKKSGTNNFNMVLRRYSKLKRSQRKKSAKKRSSEKKRSLRGGEKRRSKKRSQKKKQKKKVK